MGKTFNVPGNSTAKRQPYSPGMHGFKKQEQQRLTTKYTYSVSGTTHESEHVMGYKVIAPGLARGKSAFARNVENTASAYQEVKRFHRAHIGTGNHGNWRGTGDSSDDYRAWQRTALEESEASVAVQLNQLQYAFVAGFQTNSIDQTASDVLAANDSFTMMVENMGRVTYVADDNTSVTVGIPVTALQRAEMYLSRIAAQTGQWPTTEQIAKAKAMFSA